MSEKAILHSDGPITSRRHDLLSRAPFADRIADAIVGWTEDESLVVAIYGAWGSGKTSVKNMVVESLQESEPAPTIIEFNPWEWTDRSTLASAFFERIGSELERSLARKWKAYAAALGVAYSSALKARDVVGGVVAATALGFGTTVATSGTVHTVLTWATVVFGFLTAALLLSHSLASGVAWLLSFGRVPGSLSEVKDQLDKAMRKSKRRFLVIIDDLDRLEASDIRLMLQLVRVNADLPHLVYLLTFDRAVVERVLTVDSMDGASYLAKIVQAGFDLPLSDGTAVASLLTAELDRVLGEELRTRFEPDRWARVFPTGVAPFFRSLRDVRRYINALEFNIGALVRSGTLEANPIDFVLIEILRTFVPAVYSGLPEPKEDILAPVDFFPVPGGKEREEVLKTKVEARLGAAPIAVRPEARAVLCSLFPSVARAFDRMAPHSSGAEELRLLRVCRREYFDRYFALALPEGALLDADINRLVDASPDRSSFAAHLRELMEGVPHDKLFERLSAAVDEVVAEDIPNVFGALLDVGDDIETEHSPSFILPPDRYAVLTLDDLIRKLPEADRADVALSGVSDSSGLYLPVDWASRQQASEDGKSGEEAVLDASAADLLAAPALERLRTAAADGRLANSQYLGRLLFDWSRLDPAGAAAWVETFLDERSENVLVLLDAVAGYVTGPTGMRASMQLANIEFFVPVEKVADRVTALDTARLGEHDQALLRAFRRALARRERGLPDDPFDDDLPDSD